MESTPIKDQTEKSGGPTPSTFQGKTFIITPDKLARLGLIEQIKNVFKTQVAPKITPRAQNKTRIKARVSKVSKIKSSTQTPLSAQTAETKLDRLSVDQIELPNNDNADKNAETVTEKSSEPRSKSPLNSINAILNKTQEVMQNSVVEDSTNEKSSGAKTYINKRKYVMYRPRPNITVPVPLKKVMSKIKDDDKVIVFSCLEKSPENSLDVPCESSTEELKQLDQSLECDTKTVDNISTSNDECIKSSSTDDPKTIDVTIEKIVESPVKKINVLSIEPVFLPKIDLEQISQSVVRDKFTMSPKTGNISSSETTDIRCATLSPIPIEGVVQPNVSVKRGRKRKSESKVIEEPTLVLHTKRTRKKKYESEFITDEEYESAMRLAENDVTYCKESINRPQRKTRAELCEENINRAAAAILLNTTSITELPGTSTEPERYTILNIFDTDIKTECIDNESTVPQIILCKSENVDVKSEVFTDLDESQTAVQIDLQSCLTDLCLDSCCMSQEKS